MARSFFPLFGVLGLALLALPLLPAPLEGAEEGRPPGQIRLVEKRFEELSSREIGALGKAAFGVAPNRWKHAETDNFVVHFRRKTEAQRAAREVEYNLWFVAKALGAGPERYAAKSHIFIFQGTGEWKSFLSETGTPLWSGSFASGGDLFLNVGGPGEEFDSPLLAHEATHAVVSRLYPGKRWPLWLNEGFAEYMGGASVAARRQQYLKGFQRDLSGADLSLEQLEALKQYPSEDKEIAQLYASSERVVRFLMTEFPRERIAQFVDSILAGNNLEKAVLEVYGDKVDDFATFKSRYVRFER